MSLALDKRPVLELRKDAEKAILAKNLYGVEANVVAVIDRSGSMDTLYANGQVQNAMDRCLALAAEFDPDGKSPVFAFHNQVFYVGDIDMKNHANFVQEQIVRKIGAGGTSYAPVMREILNRFGNGPKAGGIMGFGASRPKAKLPTYVLFFTDGDNDDHAATEAIVRESREHGIFWQFVGIGSAAFSFLRRLDDMKGPGLDNADFFPFDSGPNNPDEELYKKLLSEFPAWLKAAKKEGLVA